MSAALDSEIRCEVLTESGRVECLKVESREEKATEKKIGIRDVDATLCPLNNKYSHHLWKGSRLLGV